MSRREEILERYQALSGILNERSRRIFAAAEAMAYGHGGIRLLSEIMDIAPSTIWHGKQDILDAAAIAEEIGGDVPTDNYIRRFGGGRKRLVVNDPTLLSDLDALVAPTTRGDPMSPLVWTCKSLRNLADALVRKGHKISHTTVANLLKQLGYSLQGNSKSLENADVPGRDEQFKHIDEVVCNAMNEGNPAISVDTKKKELVGEFKNGGKEWEPKGDPKKVNVHDFPDDGKGKAVPYGVYDIAMNSGFVNVGITADTAEFAVATIRSWWYTVAILFYTSPNRLVITADCGGSNGYRTRLWKIELQKLADEIGVPISVCHYPPGTSKWNKIEHRLFSFITGNWRGQPLTSYQVIVNLISATKNSKGLEVRCVLDEHVYEKGRKVSDQELAKVNLVPDDFYGKWNYEIRPGAPT
jgi:hypothetical protein